VGNNGETLVADSSTSTGLRYQGSQAAGKNYCINGGFDIWQRGTSSSASLTYATADRWFQYTFDGTATYSQETTIVPTGARYAMKLLSSATPTNPFIWQAIETANAIGLAGKTVALSAELASSVSINWTIRLAYSTSTDVTPGGSYTNITATSGGSATTTSTTYTRSTAIFAVPSDAKSLRISFIPNALGSGNAAYVGNVQLELGSVATAFTRAGGTIQGELAACQRYYFRYTGEAYAGYATGWGLSANQAIALSFVPVQMRVIPTTLEYSTLNFSDGATAGITPTTLVFYGSSNTSQAIWVQGTKTGDFTSYRPYKLAANNSTSAYLAFGAEL
jgi:hypothetical protein